MTEIHIKEPGLEIVFKTDNLDPQDITCLIARLRVMYDETYVIPDSFFLSKEEIALRLKTLKK